MILAVNVVVKIPPNCVFSPVECPCWLIHQRGCYLFKDYLALGFYTP